MLTSYTGYAERRSKVIFDFDASWLDLTFGNQRWNQGTFQQALDYNIDQNEHLVVLNAFINYCGSAVKLRGHSHISTIVHSSFQRCPIWYEAPETGDWNGNGAYALATVIHAGGEAYHDGVNGNPAGARWYSHVARVWDPSGLWKGEIVSLYTSPGEQHDDENRDHRNHEPALRWHPHVARFEYLGEGGADGLGIRAPELDDDVLEHQNEAKRDHEPVDRLLEGVSEESALEANRHGPDHQRC